MQAQGIKGHRESQAYHRSVYDQPQLLSRIHSYSGARCSVVSGYGTKQ